MEKKAFTLIELLVVIAIIGILAGIVLVSLRGTRNQARDARVISAMQQLRTLGQTYENENGSYDGFCSSTEAVKLANDIKNQGANPSTTFDCQQALDGSAFCAWVRLNSGKWYCVDSYLNSVTTNDYPDCQSHNFNCSP